MTIHGAGFSARSGAGNNDKTTVAEKGILLAMCHPHAGSRYLFSIHHRGAWRFRVHVNPSPMLTGSKRPLAEAHSLVR